MKRGESSAPFGAKGIGEPVIVYVAPAILNGVCSYLGTRVNEIPLTNERIIKSLNNKAAN